MGVKWLEPLTVGDPKVVLYRRKHHRTERQNMTNHVYIKLACLVFTLEAYAFSVY